MIDDDDDDNDDDDEAKAKLNPNNFFIINIISELWRKMLFGRLRRM